MIGMNNILVIIAMLFCAISIAIGSLTKDSWRATGITFVFLLIGVGFFSLALTI